MHTLVWIFETSDDYFWVVILIYQDLKIFIGVFITSIAVILHIIVIFIFRFLVGSNEGYIIPGGRANGPVGGISSW